MDSQNVLVYEAYVEHPGGPHLDYCSQLWAPGEGQKLQNLEKILKDFTRNIPEVNQLGFWQRLRQLKMNSVQRRIERYKIIYVWKTLENLVPDCGVTLNSEDDRRGRMCAIPTLKHKERTKRENSFQVTGPKLFNAMPKYIRNMKNCQTDEFKEKLDSYLTGVPDEPKVSGLMPLNFQQSNSLLYRVTRRRERSL